MDRSDSEPGTVVTFNPWIYLRDVCWWNMKVMFPVGVRSTTTRTVAPPPTAVSAPSVCSWTGTERSDWTLTTSPSEGSGECVCSGPREHLFVLKYLGWDTSIGRKTEWILIFPLQIIVGFWDFFRCITLTVFVFVLSYCYIYTLPMIKCKGRCSGSLFVLGFRRRSLAAHRGLV